MKHEPRPAIHMEKPLLSTWVGMLVGWRGGLGDLQSRANRVSQVDGVSNMASICQLYGSVGEEFRKHTMDSVYLSVGRNWSLTPRRGARHFNSSLYITGAFQGVTLMLELRGMSLSVVCLRDSLRPAVSSTDSIPTGFCSQ